MSDRSGETPDNPGVLAPPPLIYGGALAVGLLVGRLYPVAVLPRKVSRVLGWSLLAGGLVLGSSGIDSQRRAETNVDPYKPTTAIVETGPYRYTRNPLYVGLTLMYGGVTALTNSLPTALLLPVVLGIMKQGVIEREERYLEGKFGDEYLRYKMRVRRWL